MVVRGLVGGINHSDNLHAPARRNDVWIDAHGWPGERRVSNRPDGPDLPERMPVHLGRLSRVTAASFLVSSRARMGSQTLSALSAELRHPWASTDSNP